MSAIDCVHYMRLAPGLRLRRGFNMVESPRQYSRHAPLWRIWKNEIPNFEWPSRSTGDPIVDELSDQVARAKASQRVHRMGYHVGKVKRDATAYGRSVSTRYASAAAATREEIVWMVDNPERAKQRIATLEPWRARTGGIERKYRRDIDGLRLRLARLELGWSQGMASVAAGLKGGSEKISQFEKYGPISDKQREEYERYARRLGVDLRAPAE